MSDIHKNFVTPVGRGSFLCLFEKGPTPSGDEKFQGAYLIPMDDKEGVAAIKKAIRSAIVSKWGDDKKKWPKNLDIPLRNGTEKADEVLAQKGTDSMATYRGHYYMNAKSDYPPGVVGPTAKPLMDQGDIWPGCYMRFNVNFYPYAKAGNQGVGVGLQNVMLVKQSEERWDGRIGAEAAFGQYASEEADDLESASEEAPEGKEDSGDDDLDFDD